MAGAGLASSLQGGLGWASGVLGLAQINTGWKLEPRYGFEQLMMEAGESSGNEHPPLLPCEVSPSGCTPLRQESHAAERGSQN